MQEQYSRGMNRQVRLHRTDDCELVSTSGDVRKQATHRHSALAMLCEFPRTSQPPAIAVCGRIFRLRERLIVELSELGLGIEGIDVRNPAVHETKNDVLRLRGKMRLWQRQAARLRFR